MPKDFEEKRKEYYEALRQPPEAEAFVQQLQEQMIAALHSFDQALPKLEDKVRISAKKGGWIHLTPLSPQAEPSYLRRLKAEIGKRWGMTSPLSPTHLRGPERQAGKESKAEKRAAGSVKTLLEPRADEGGGRAKALAGLHRNGSPFTMKAGFLNSFQKEKETADVYIRFHSMATVCPACQAGRAQSAWASLQDGFRGW